MKASGATSISPVSRAFFTLSTGHHLVQRVVEGAQVRGVHLSPSAFPAGSRASPPASTAGRDRMILSTSPRSRPLGPRRRQRGRSCPSPPGPTPKTSSCASHGADVVRAASVCGLPPGRFAGRYVGDPERVRVHGGERELPLAGAREADRTVHVGGADVVPLLEAPVEVLEGEPCLGAGLLRAADRDLVAPRHGLHAELRLDDGEVLVELAEQLGREAIVVEGERDRLALLRRDRQAARLRPAAPRDRAGGDAAGWPKRLLPSAAVIVTSTISPTAPALSGTWTGWR